MIFVYGALIYLCGMLFTCYAVQRWLGWDVSNWRNNEEVKIILTTLLWPIGGPFCLIIQLFKRVSNKAKRHRNKSVM
jgi:hypothetical protein